MNGSSARIPPDTAMGRGLAALREIGDQMRSPAGRTVRAEAERVDVRDAVLEVLAGQPSSGYQIVRVLQERGRGARTPGAGAVYPTLQLLADEGLATAAETDGSKVWTLTTAGQAAAETARAKAVAVAPGPARRGAIARSGAQLAQVVALATQGATPDQVAEVVAALDDARRRILSVLARN